MFIRFVGSELDEQSHVLVGLFTAVYDLLDEVPLAQYEYQPLRKQLDWFNEHLKVPFDYRLTRPMLQDRSICWFRSSAHEHLSHAWEMVWILDARNIFIRTIKCQKPGYVLYEDEAQILAHPFADVRGQLRR